MVVLLHWSTSAYPISCLLDSDCSSSCVLVGSLHCCSPRSPTSCPQSNMLYFDIGMGLSILYIILTLFDSSLASSKFNAGIISFVISENAAIGDVVGTLDSFNGSDYSKKQDDRPLFMLQDTTYFALKGPGQKTVVVNRLLDRDNDRKLCREPSWPETCAWSGVLFAHDGVVFSLRITIIDVNDNIPRWPDSALSKLRNSKEKEPSIELFIAENAPTGSMFDLPLAEDRDYGKNGIVNYELVKTDGNGRFSLLCTAGPNGVIPRLQVLEVLDREEREEYEMQMAAIDGGGQRVVVGLRVYLVDENDNPPIFVHLKNFSQEEARQARFVIEIDESLSVGTALHLHPTATDADAGDFGRVRYRFSFSTPEFVRRDFAIESETGKIIVQNILDCDSGGIPEYVFSMIAEDGAPQPLTALATVVIILHDVNDNAPIISLTPATPKVEDMYDTTFYPTFDESRDNFCLVEEMPSGQLVATVAVSDPDSDADGEFECDLDGTPDFTLHTLPWIGATKVYQLLSARRFDREVEALTSVTLKCVDRGVPPQISSKIIPITLIDKNDNQPYFQQQLYQFSIQENRPPGTLVGRVIVQDNDAGTNGRVEFSLACKTDRYQHLFSINERGEIRANEMLDREINSQVLLFTVVAEDKGRPVYRTSAEVGIEIEDENDCIPKFGSPNYHFSIDEDVEPYRRSAREVGTVQATDCDTGSNAEVHYFLEKTDTPFKISPNGTIFAVQQLDRETKSSYLLTVVARDSPSPRSPSKALNSTAQVRITVTDINDHSPIFIFPRLNSTSNSLPEIRISALEPIGYRVAKLQAKDADTGVNANIRYTLTEESSVSGTGKLFHLSEDSGELFIAAKLSTSAKEMRFRLQIQATDGGIPPRSSTFSLIVYLDPSLPPTSALGYMGDSVFSGQMGESREALTNIYLIIIIAFGVSIAFVVLVVAIFLMSKGYRLRYCCPFPAHVKGAQMNTVEAVSFYTPGSSQLPTHSTPMGFANGADYMTNAESASYALEKGSPLQCPPSDEVFMSSPGHLQMNAFYEATVDKAFHNSNMVAPIENSLYTDQRSINDASSLTTCDRFSSLGRVTHGGYPPLSLCLVNEGCPEATYFGQANQFRGANGGSAAVYSWCNSTEQRMQTFSPVQPSYAR
uniref:Protocadherin 1 n=1 Tax=Echinococcus granulosus TaxID=6210 RepID=A0A068X0W1_ECHGR|nr:protocadherin 1 [Echinococcus granulosus]